MKPNSETTPALNCAISEKSGATCIENAEKYTGFEPVAWMFETERGMTLFSEYEPVSGLYAEGTLMPLYLHPTKQMKPMTAEEMAYGFTEPRHSQWQAFVAGVKLSESHQMSKLSLRRKIWIYTCTPFICILVVVFVPVVF